MDTPNPNNKQFQFKISDLRVATTWTNGPLNDFINNIEGYEKFYGKTDEAFLIE